MQKITSLYGLTVDFDEGKHLEYYDLKGMLSDIFRDSEKKIKQNHYKGVCAGLASINDDRYLTFFTKNQRLHLGVYNEREKIVSDHCHMSDLKMLTKEQLDRVAWRIENYVKNNGVWGNKYGIKLMKSSSILGKNVVLYYERQG